MDKILAINTIKNVFSALGAKTSDSNYAVALLDKTSAEPKGMMDFANLASALGVPKFVDGIPINDQPSFSVQYCITDPNVPVSENYFMCFTIINRNDGAQIGVGSTNGLYFRFKINDSWLLWQKVVSNEH